MSTSSVRHTGSVERCVFDLYGRFSRPHLWGPMIDVADEPRSLYIMRRGSKSDAAYAMSGMSNDMT